MASSIRLGRLARAPAGTAPTAPASAAGEARIAALDGLRGVLAIMVVVGHYLGEVPAGFKGAMFAWIAVKMFFVLSGFLMARIIMEHLASPGFFTAFYVRRACRTLPLYLLTLAIVFGAALLFEGAPWLEAERILPLWSHLTFTQGFAMVARGDYGSDWLTPTWTLTVEEQFYLIAPLVCLLAGRRHLLLVLAGAVLVSICWRLLAYGAGVLPPMAANVLLPGAAHSMFLGMIGALLLASPSIDWRRWDEPLRLGAIVCLAAVFGMRALDGTGERLFQMWGVPLVSLACTLFLVSILRGAPEADRLRSPALRFLGRLSYGIYLLHMPALGLMHGLILGGRPDIATPAQIAVTVAAVAATLGLAWLANVAIEQPMIECGRRWRFARAAGA